MTDLIVKDNIKIEDLIYEVRDKQVMLDKDVAFLYNVETKRVNEVIKRNINRFPDSFCFKLIKEELEGLSLRSQIATLNKSGNYTGMHYKYLPYALTEQGIIMLLGLLRSDTAVKNNMNKFIKRYSYILTEEEYNVLWSNFLTSKGGSRKNHTVFTEQGVAMLATILKTKTATSVSIKIMDAFVAMRRYIASNNYEKRISNIETKLIDYDNKLDLVFDKLDNTVNNHIFFEGGIMMLIL